MHNNKISVKTGFPGGSEVKVSACNAGDLGSIPGSGRFPGEGNGNPLQYSSWRIPWTEEPQSRKESDMTERLHYHYCHYLSVKTVLEIENHRISTSGCILRNGH